MRSAQHERQHGRPAAERQMLVEVSFESVVDAPAERLQSSQGVSKFPLFPKLWMMMVQLEKRENNIEAAREAGAKGTKNCPHCVDLWRVVAAVETEAGHYNRARSLLETARLKNPGTPALWLDTIRNDVKDNNRKLAEARLAQGLQECPTSGLLWCEAIMMEARTKRKAKSIDAIKRCESDPLVIMTVARLFWADRKLDRAKTWFNRAVTLNPDLGDAWAYFYKFTLQNGTEEEVSLFFNG